MSELIQPRVSYALAQAVLQIAPGFSVQELKQLDNTNPYSIYVYDYERQSSPLGHFINQHGMLDTRANVYVEQKKGLSKGSGCVVFGLVYVDFIRM